MKAAIIPVTPFAQNSCVIWCEKTMRGAVTDPGGDLDKILAVAEENGVTIEKILITHAHLDHAGATAELAEKLIAKEYEEKHQKKLQQMMQKKIPKRKKNLKNQQEYL